MTSVTQDIFVLESAHCNLVDMGAKKQGDSMKLIHLPAICIWRFS